VLTALAHVRAFELWSALGYHADGISARVRINARECVSRHCVGNRNRLS
jgi:hypothetical protein